MTRFYWFIRTHGWPSLSCAGIPSCPVPHSWACSPSPTWGTLPSPPSRPGPTGQSNKTQDRKKEPAGKTPVKCTANEGPVRIQYKCLVSNYVFLNEGIIMFCLLIPTLIYLWEIYIFPGSVCQFCCREIAHRYSMNVEIGTEAMQFLEKEYIYGIFLAVWTDLANSWSADIRRVRVIVPVPFRTALWILG